MEALKTISNEEFYDINDEDVIKFLIYKDVNDSGRTLVHHSTCPNIGTKTTEECVDKVKCGLRHQSESVRVGIIDKLRKGFEEDGKKGAYKPDTQLGDPTRSKKVSEYMVFKRKEQGMLGVLQTQAKHL